MCYRRDPVEAMGKIGRIRELLPRSKNQKLERIQGSRVKAETENGLVLLGHCGGGGGNVRL